MRWSSSSWRLPGRRARLGQVGAGELPPHAPHAAIINAIYHACGVRITSLACAPGESPGGFEGHVRHPQERMDPREIQQLEELCVQDDAPWCQAKCPLHVDVRGMLEALARGDFRQPRASTAEGCCSPQYSVGSVTSRAERSAKEMRRVRPST